MSNRTWFKIYSDKWLGGTIREEAPEVRGIFVDLLALAATGEYGDSGIIALKNGVGMTDLQIQKMLSISKNQWQKAKKRLIFTERIAVNDANIIQILNWKKYQSEYERQKPYREKLQPKVTTEGYRNSYAGDRDIKDINREKVTKGRSYKVVN